MILPRVEIKLLWRMARGITYRLNLSRIPSRKTARDAAIATYQTRGEPFQRREMRKYRLHRESRRSSPIYQPSAPRRACSR